MAGESLQQSPPRMTLTNVETGDSITAQFNPDEVKEKLAVNYQLLEILGLSHQPMQYRNTSNLAISYELGFDAMSAREIESNKGGASFSNVHYARLFLHSLCYPRRGAQGVPDGGPPRVLFSWPNLYSLTCKITGLDFTQKRFDITLRPVVFSCLVQISEIRTVRLFSEDLLANGTLR